MKRTLEPESLDFTTQLSVISSRRSKTIACGTLAVVLLVATAVRVAPLIEGGDRLQRQCVCEDGYLMLTIARNVALGHGFSVSNGTIPTNGTQPLSAVLYAIAYMCVGGDKIAGLYLVVGIQFIISVATGVVLYVFTRRCLHKTEVSKTVALLAAAVWYASPTSILSTQNGLETGLCALMIVLSIALYDAWLPYMQTGRAIKHSLILGAILGITFLARNDACFLIAALLGVHVALSYRSAVLARGIIQAFVMGAVSVVAASPWLWFNVTRFGHIVPISGRAESLNFEFAGNFMSALVALLEDLLLVLRIPTSVQDNGTAKSLAGVVLLAIVVLAWWKRKWLAERFSPGVAILSCFVVALFAYYSLLFGMPSFLGRYLFPATTLSAVVVSAVVVAVAGRSRESSRAVLVPVAGLLASVLCIGLDARVYAKGTEHMHFQVVDWVADNVPESTWVGAVQTGTLGYYHDNTINLDGKVDPYALEARERGETAQYVVQRRVEYIADWRSVAATWAEIPAFSANYELLVDDAALDLGVLIRRSSIAPSTASATQTQER